MSLDFATFERISPRQQDTGPAVDPAPTPSGCRPGPRWFVVSTYAQAERRASHSLAQKGYQTYLPMMTVSRRDRVVQSMIHRVEVPLFPAYLFAWLDLRDPWWPIRYAPGVFRLLTNASQIPEPVPEGVVEALEASEAARATPIPETGRWAPGTPCSLGKGYVMGGLPAVVLDSSRNRVKIGIMFLGDIRIVSVPPECLVKRDALN